MHHLTRLIPLLLQLQQTVSVYDSVLQYTNSGLGDHDDLCKGGVLAPTACKKWQCPHSMQEVAMPPLELAESIFTV